MEWKELEAIWQQYDARIAENTRINKEVLKRMLRAKPERRLKRMRGWAIYRIVTPIPVMCIALVPNTKFRNEWDFYLGLFLLIAMLAYMLYCAYQYFSLIRDIDFRNQVAKTKKQLIQLEGLKLKVSKLEVFVGFVMLIGIYLIAQFAVRVNTKHFIVFCIIITLFILVGQYVQFKKFKSKLNTFNAELDEIEQLEKE